MPKRKQKEEYAPDAVEERKQLLVTQARRHKLKPWPEDHRRFVAGAGNGGLQEGKSIFLKRHTSDEEEKAKQARLRDLGEWYIMCSGSFLVRLHHSWVSDKAWAFFEKESWPADDYGLDRVQKALQESGRWWAERISPHGGGVLDIVELEEAGECMVNVKEKLWATTYDSQSYFFPASQVELVWQFYPEANPFLARDLVGHDLWGDEVRRSCPLTFADGDEGERVVVAFVMPMHWR